MAKAIKPLTATQVDRAKPKEKEYSLFDGDGLYLVVRPSRSKTWTLRIKDQFDKVHKAKLGSYPEVTLSMAREKCFEYRRALAEGKTVEEVLGKGEYAHKTANSLEIVARSWLDQYSKRKPLDEHTKHKRIRKLENHLFCSIGHYPIEHIRPKDLRKVLNNIYEKSADNAQRMRSLGSNLIGIVTT